MPLSNFFTLRTSGGLFVGLQVLVDDADAAGLGHGDGERAFGHRVHGGGHQRNAEIDGVGQTGGGVGFGRQDIGGRWFQQDVVEGQAVGDIHAISVSELAPDHTQMGGKSKPPGHGPATPIASTG